LPQFTGLEALFQQSPELVLVQEIPPRLCSSAGSILQKIPVGHVEAGLRTDELFNPCRANRRLISQMSCLHFAPTTLAVESATLWGGWEIHQTGNTVIYCR